MQLCTMYNARATIGGPSLESRTPCSTALFHWMTTFGDCANAELVSKIVSATAMALRKRNRRALRFAISSPLAWKGQARCALDRDRNSKKKAQQGVSLESIDSRIVCGA